MSIKQKLNHGVTSEILVDQNSAQWKTMIAPVRASMEKVTQREKLLRKRSNIRIKNNRFPQHCYAKKKPGPKPGKRKVQKSYRELYPARRPELISRPCMTCEKPFLSEGKHNRLCAHCRNLSSD